MIQRASFRCFKALEALDVDLSPFTLLVGKNGSGKTSVLQGIQRVLRIGFQASARDRAHDALRARLSALFDEDDIRRLFTMPTDAPLSLSVTERDGRTLRMTAALMQAGERHRLPEKALCDVHVDCADGSSIVISTPSTPGTGEAPFPLSPGAPLVDHDVFGSGAAAYLRFDAVRMVQPSFTTSSMPRLEQDGTGLSSVLSYLAGAEPDILAAITRDLRAVVPQVRSIRVFPTTITRRREERIVIGDQAVNRPVQEEVPGHRFALDMGPDRIIPADLLSEGTVLALGLLVALRHPSLPKLVLADDIDKALHPDAQADLVRCLRTIQQERPDLQIVCTTHSPYLLDHVALDEVRVMALDDAGHAVCRKLSDHPESARFRDMLRTGEFWASVGEDWVKEPRARGT
ncbi:AAA family ATPase [Chondromyces apiculatus]|uniref:AAA+ ATPase domain-containing protein n=1 Tax=Chondromyces apiculatus DSM 436 TaxID=1192034 RepID=A0A017SUH5_9BACT|nr:ATP-binding protein [Chondromyces apiculatus]EYF00599.1 Hypothetical protein CAP_0414 [Chondromyces apiculatus DSM 436]